MNTHDMNHMNHSDPVLAREHMAAMSLLETKDATHVAVSSGDWSDASTWKNGNIPGNGADVHIPDGIEVNYDVVSNAKLHFVRVDGNLTWETQSNTKMVVDTIIGTPTSKLTIGTTDRPVNANVSTDIIIADNGAINLSDDPTQVSRGIVAHGEISIHGAKKEAYLAVDGYPQAGDNKIKLGGDLSNWEVGDVIVVMGTEQGRENSKGQLITQDEERVITSISSDGTVTLNSALNYDHESPPGYDFDVFVGNQTRNVTVTSENPDGVRGHFMVMHSDGADIRYAEFNELGRTDVSVPRGTTDNVNGRYPLHLHRTGVGEDAEMGVLVGNAVVGGPGWGIVQHESFAAVDFNFVYDIQGAGIVSEAGNERGQWIGNFVTSIYGDGDDLSHVRDELEGDFGHAGVAYENQARQIIQQDNIASSSNYGWVFRATEAFANIPGEEEITLDRSTLQFDPDPLGGQVVGEEAQIMGFTGNIAVGVHSAFDSGHRVGITQETDLHSQIFDFTVWNSDRAIDLFNYTGNYVIKDSTFVNGFQAIKLPGKHEGTNLINVTIDSFLEGIMNGGYNSEGVLVDVQMKNVKKQFITPDGKPMEIIDSNNLKMLDAPIVNIGGNSDLVMSKGGGDDLFITGSITDSAGTYGFAHNRWINQPHSISDGLKVEFNSRKWHTYEEAFDYHGVIQQGNGSWIMPVTFWVTDRVTGEPHPYMVPIQVQGFSNDVLQKYEIDQYKAPDANIVVLDTRALDGTDSGVPTPKDDGHAGDDSGSDNGGTDPGGDTPDSGGGADDHGGETGGDQSGGDNGGGEPAPIDPDPAPTKPPVEPTDEVGDGSVLFLAEGGMIMSGSQEFDGTKASAINLAPTQEIQLADVEISLSFEADSLDRQRGIISSDAHKYDGDGNHMSASIRNGLLEIRFQNIDEGSDRVFKVANIEAGREYNLDIGLGSGGVWAKLDGKVIGQDTNFEMSWENNPEYLQIGALGKWSETGEGDFQGVFDGTISDVTIFDPTSGAKPKAPDVAPPAPDAEESGVMTLLTMKGDTEFTGKAPSAKNLAHKTSYEVDNATIEMTFDADTVSGYRGLISKDASGYDGGGNHLSAAIKNGVLEVRFQDESDQREFEFSGIKANTKYDLEMGFGDDGVWVKLDGKTIGQDANFDIDWSNNEEFLQIGALGKWSDTGDAAIGAIFDGTISNVAITSEMDMM